MERLGASASSLLKSGRHLKQDSVRILKDFTEIIRGFQDFVKQNRDGIVIIAKTTARIAALGAAITAAAFSLPIFAAGAQLLAGAVVLLGNKFIGLPAAVLASLAAFTDWGKIVDRAASNFEGFGERILRFVKEGEIEEAASLQYSHLRRLFLMA